MDKQPFHLLSHEGRLGCITRHRVRLHCLQLCSLLFIVYLKVLLCSRPALLCRDNHSRDKAMNDDQNVRLRLWHSYSLCFALQAGRSQCLTGEREAWWQFKSPNAQQETLGEASAGTGLLQYSVTHHLYTPPVFLLSHTPSSAEQRLSSFHYVNALQACV